MAQMTRSAMMASKTSPSIRTCHSHAHVEDVVTSSVKVIVGVIQPVLPNGAEQVELECIFERFGLVLDPRWNVQHLALADRDFLSADQKPERALENASHLIAF